MDSKGRVYMNNLLSLLDRKAGTVPLLAKIKTTLGLTRQGEKCFTSFDVIPVLLAGGSTVAHVPAQLIIGIAEGIDKAYWSGVRELKAANKDGAESSLHGVGLHLTRRFPDTAYGMQQRATAYWFVGAKDFTDLRTRFLAVDCGRIGGKSVMLGAQSRGDNLAMWMIPMAPGIFLDILFHLLFCFLF